MIIGTFRDGHPRIRLALPGKNGPLEVEFIVDTGFDGDLAVPDSLARQLISQPTGPVIRKLADGMPFRCPSMDIFLDDEIVLRPVEVLVLAGDPLVGTEFLTDNHLHVEITRGGEVIIESLR